MMKNEIEFENSVISGAQKSKRTHKVKAPLSAKDMKEEEDGSGGSFYEPTETKSTKKPSRAKSLPKKRQKLVDESKPRRNAKTPRTVPKRL